MPELKQFSNLPAEQPQNIGELDTSNPLAVVQELLSQAAQYIDNVLQGADHVFIKLRIANDLRKMQGYIGSLYGGPIPGYGGSAQDLAAQPLTRMFGQDLNRVQPINQSSMQPDDIERQAFRDRKNAMATSFMEMTDDQILSSLSQPQGEALVRSVAKTFGLEGYRDRYIDVSFIADVRDLIRDRQTITTATELANLGAEKLQNQAVITKDPDSADDDDDLQQPLAKMMPMGHVTADQILANAGANKLPDPAAGAVNANVNKAGVDAAAKPAQQQPTNPVKPKASNGQFIKKADTGAADQKEKGAE